MAFMSAGKLASAIYFVCHVFEADDYRNVYQNKYNPSYIKQSET